MFKHFSFEFPADFPFEFEKRSRVFKKGDLKYVILDLIKDKPSHGYEIIRSLEERFHGMYSPSAGSVYPTLQLLEDMGYVTAAVSDGKKVYSITEEGKRFLAEREDIVDGIKGHMRDWWGEPPVAEFAETFRVWREVARLIGGRARHVDREKWAKIREIIARTRREIEGLLESAPPPPPPPGTGPSPEPR